MEYRTKIESIFGKEIFARPLFYNYEGGLRFEMSESGSYLNRFLTAHRKGTEICDDIFRENESLTVCFKFYGAKTLISCLSTLKSLRDCEIYSKDFVKEHWSEIDEDDGFEQDFWWHYLVLEMPSNLIPNLLWCAFSADFGFIQPAPPAALYLFEFQKEVAVFPYDDRGMDVVGPNRVFIKTLYESFDKYLLDYDRTEMDQYYA